MFAERGESRGNEKCQGKKLNSRKCLKNFTQFVEEKQKQKDYRINQNSMEKVLKSLKISS